jgi:hypothetical protein
MQSKPLIINDPAASMRPKQLMPQQEFGSGGDNVRKAPVLRQTT